MVVWLLLDGLAFSIGLDQRYGAMVVRRRTCQGPSGPLSFVGTDGWAAFSLSGTMCLQLMLFAAGAPQLSDRPPNSAAQ